PAMQVADIFAMQVKLAQAGLDQRKAHVVARDVALQMRVNALHDPDGRQEKPVAIHHHLILGLRKPPTWPPPTENLQDFWASMKRSKAAPSPAVFIHDSPDEIRAKIRKAFCPPQEVTFNPILDWAHYLIFNEPDTSLTIERTPKNGGTVTFTSYDELAE